MSTVAPDKDALRVAGRPPVMSETKYDITTSAQIAIAVGLALITGVLIAIWLSNLLPEVTNEPMVLASSTGGFEDGDPDETLDVESPEDPTDDPSLSNDQNMTELEQITDQIVTLSENASQLTQPNEYTDASAGGNPGSASGTGGKPFGVGGGAKGGERREQRWLVKFADKGNLKSYAAQLDFFNIEIGAIYKDGRIFYLSNMSKGNSVRESRLSADDPRLFMSWKGGDRVKADIELLQNAKIPNPEDAMIVHFYAPQTEQMLARLEKSYGGKEPGEIRRTFFQIRKAGSGYEFFVSSQKLK